MMPFSFASALSMILLLLLIWPTGSSAYDDSRRAACVQALNADPQIQSLGSDPAASAYADSMHMLVLEQKRHHVTMQTSFSHSAVQAYGQACEKVGGIFAFLDALALGCTSNDNNSSSTDIMLSEGDCFPSTNECQLYTENYFEWYLDIKQLFGNTCTVLATTTEELEHIYQTLMTDSIDPPSGEPNFVDSSSTYNDLRRSKCMDDFSQVLFSDDEVLSAVSDEAFHHAGTSRIDLLQMWPILIQHEYYQDQDETRLATYQQLCETSGGRFDQYSGTFDCLGIGRTNQGVKTTMVVEKAATCFPAGSGACKDYTMREWRLDMALGKLEQSCTIRGDDSSSTTAPTTGGGGGGSDSTGAPSFTGDNNESSPPPMATISNDNKDSNARARKVLLTTLAVSAAMAGVVVWNRRRRQKQDELVSVELSQMSLRETYSDDTKSDPELNPELPSVA